MVNGILRPIYYITCILNVVLANDMTTADFIFCPNRRLSRKRTVEIIYVTFCILLADKKLFQRKKNECYMKGPVYVRIHLIHIHLCIYHQKVA